jgi:hypothetical protein
MTSNMLKPSLQKYPLDFREIPPANTGNGDQDTFEEFAQEFLEAFGYVIEEPASRGADGGKDLLVLEINGENVKRWLVSCKHFVHSGRSVSPNDEINITDRLEQFGCQGFIGFYSTLASSALIERLKSYKTQKRIDYKIFNRSKIQRLLVTKRQLQHLLQIYFPESFRLIIHDYAWEKLYTAIWILAGGTGDLRERIENAYVSALMRLKPDDFPKGLRREFSYILERLTREEPTRPGEGKIRATLSTMTEVELDRYVERIVSIYDRYRGMLTID